MRSTQARTRPAPPLRFRTTHALHMDGVGAEAPAPAPSAFSPQHPTRLTVALRLRASAEAVVAFHSDIRNLPRITPGRARILRATVPSRPGDLQIIELGVWPLTMRLHARILDVTASRIVDVLEGGPFAFFRQSRRIVPVPTGAILIDTVEFRFREGRLGTLFDVIAVRPVLHLLFAERHRRTRALLEGGSRPSGQTPESRAADEPAP